MPIPIEAKELWTAGGVLLGFQATAFAWRIAEESKVAERSDIVWLPPADYLNLAAMATNVIGVFIMPGLGLASVRCILISFGLAALLFLGHAFAVAAHYELYGRGHQRSFLWWPRQEKIAILVVSLAVFVYLYLALWIR